MTDLQVLWGSVATIVIAVVYIIRFVLLHYGKADFVGKFDKYKPYAMMAAKWVEENVPDDYGANDDDPRIARATHKLDLFLKKFNDLVVRVDGKDANEELKHEAMAWSVELAERLNLPGSVIATMSPPLSGKGESAEGK